MRTTLILLLSVCLLKASGQATEEERPNILFVFLDDFGWKDTSFMGSDFYETPHLDKLAEGGMVFTNAYSAAANCAPARASLMSGQYTPRHEIFNVGTKPRGKAKYRKLEHIAGVDTLRTDIVTWAQCLQKSGYKTATFGKWHLSDDPLPYGFDYNVGGTHAGGPPNGYYPPHPKGPNLQDAPQDEYLTDTLANKACEFIRDNRDQSWAIYLTCFAVHTPIQAKEDLVDKYEDKPPGSQHDNVAMATMVQAVDDGVGRIIAELKEQNLDEKTAVVFFSDNGGYGPATDMAPLKGYKGTYYEGGIRVPFFINWPGKVKPNQTNETPIIGVDLYPTLCAMAGVELPVDQPLDGQNLVPLMTTGSGKEELATRPLFWHFPAYLQSYARKNQQRDRLFRSRPCSIVRRGDWKLHEYFEDGSVELYNLADDIGESTNLAQKEPNLVTELKGVLSDWRKEINAPVPTALNPKYDAKAEKKALLGKAK